MDSDFAVRLMTEALLAAIKIAAPILIATLAVGLLISIIQVVTQIQEMTLTFVPKIIVVALMLIFFGSWMLSIAIQLARRMFEVAGSM
ncbi:flagellar biosynthetic protein FliQ [Lysobacter pythonis]|uniref:Flagellar biosynthetic protein FliQ n=1 Tax=Solilutibacter pythonis TaxID=2483112 RepID=A0A3M2I123_9GAMM|nr:flagellar biosynthesis protein FliQ [Lysobacter pythonis]RMH94075.1 flagellar biosynthetic protein FliQ [Lysobacter pythonis]